VRARQSAASRERGTRSRLLAATVVMVAAALVACVVGAIASSDPTSASVERGRVCLPSATPDQLDRLFVAEPGGVVGADYQRTTPLPDGRVVWTFQDAEVRLPQGGTRLVHNIGMIQEGSCFTVLMSGTPDDPRPWLFADATTPFAHWYWPLGAEVGVDGQLYVFVAEMYERGPGYLSRTEPASTAVAIVDVSTFEVRATTRPADGSASLYGFSIESDSTWTYLFAQCHRQFGFDPYIFVYAHDRSCSSQVTVARVPRGQLLAPAQYWTGRGWGRDPAAAVPILDTSRMVNASQFLVVNGQWLAITKVGDWWGDRIVVEYSLRPVGPYVVVAEWVPPVKCPVDCNTYFASWVPSSRPGQLYYGLSHNRWDGIATEVYRPTFGAVAAPPRRLIPAERCSLGYCG
jgi:hypothetical protein